jgi:hypothetical protein
MCEPTTIAYAAAAVVGSYAATKAMAPDIPTPQATTPTAPPSKQADGKQPDVKAMRGANAAASGVNAGPASTFLTGPSGIDPSQLTLGKNTLLGQ